MKNNIKILVARYLLWAVVVAIMVVIFAFSAKTAEQSSENSGSVVKTILSIIVSDFSELSEDTQQTAVDNLQFIVRKGAHFSVFLTLGLFCLFAMNTYIITARQKVIVALLISLLYAISDEIHQLFVPGRSGQISDVLIDFAGAATGVAFAMLLIWIFRKIQIKRGKRLEKKYAH